MTRSDEAFRECTRDPIFLFQKKIITWIGLPHGWGYQDESWINEENPDEVLCESEAIERFRGTEQGPWNQPCFLEHWYTELVFLTRGEGEAFGLRKAYNYLRGWRVYCVPCEGELARHLNLTVS